MSIGGLSALTRAVAIGAGLRWWFLLFDCHKNTALRSRPLIVSRLGRKELAKRIRLLSLVIVRPCSASARRRRGTFVTRAGVAARRDGAVRPTEFLCQ